MIRTLDHPAQTDHAYNPECRAAARRMLRTAPTTSAMINRYIDCIPSTCLNGSLATAWKNDCCGQPADVADTCTDVSALRRDVGYAPGTTIEHGGEKFVAWYREYVNR